MRSQSVSRYRLPFSLQCLGSHQICSLIVYSRQIHFTQRHGRRSGGKYPSRHRGKTRNVSPASAVTLSQKRDEHNELHYRLAGSININTDAPRRCRGWSGADTKKILDEGQPGLFVLLPLCKKT